MKKQINPRRPYVISANGLKRIILGAEEGERDLHLIAHTAAKKTFRTTRAAERYFMVFVHSDRGMLDEHAKEAIAAAALLANDVTAVVVAVFGELNVDVGVLGADVVTVLPQLELKLALANDMIHRYSPVHIFIPDRSSDGDFGRRLAARTKRSVATDVVELGADYALRTIAGGHYARCSLPQIVLLSRTIAETNLPFIGRGLVQEAPALQPVPSPVRDLGIEISSPDKIGLEEADFIISAGNGMRDLPTFNKLANLFGASIGASRVAVDDGRFGRDKQIGATGKTVQSTIYMALGISGAVQHLQGIKDCQHVIAVNLDEGAPIAKRADVMVVEDTHMLMHALVNEITVNKTC